MRTVGVQFVLVAGLVASCAGQGTPDLVRDRAFLAPAARSSRPGEEAARAPEDARDGKTARDGSAGAPELGRTRGTSVIPFIVAPPFFLPEPSTIERSLLFAFDEATREVLALPGAGVGTLGPAYFGDRFILFYRLEGGVFAYDTQSETVTTFDDVNLVGSSFRPSISRDGRTMIFLADPPDVPPVKGLFGREPTPFSRVYLYRDGAVGELAVIDALARQEGGIDRLRVAGNGEVIGFSTRLGGVYLYTIGANLALKAQGPPARDPALSPDGGVMVWTTGRGEEPSRLFVTLVSTHSEPVTEPTHESATQVILSPASRPPGTRAERPLVIYAPSRPWIPLVEASLAVGPRIVSISAANDRIQIVSYDQTRGTFRWWRYVFAGDFLEMLTPLNLTGVSSGTGFSDAGGGD